MKKTGTLQSWNVSPKGAFEGFLLKSAKNLIQINLPKEQFQSLAGKWKLGSRISVKVEAEDARGVPAHRVFRLLDAPGNGHKETGRTFSGRIERLNYARHGEVNGGILESGDFLHLKPEGARAIGIEVGMDVKAHGKTKPMAGGNVVIEAEEVNGVAIGPRKDKKKHAK